MTMSLGERARYFLGCLWNYGRRARSHCPNCGFGGPHRFIESKYFVTRLMECPECAMRFRVPTDPESINRQFYQEDYREGFTTDCPDERGLAALLATEFKGHEKDFSRFVDLVRTLDARPGLLLCDYGCSWGYGSWQFARAGYQVEGYEVSLPRARYAAEKLGVRLTPDLAARPGSFDIFFSSHVLEHVPSVRDVWALAMKALKPGGYFVAATPNGGEGLRLARPALYSKTWGKVHPNMLNETFYTKLFAGVPCFLDSTPWDQKALAAWDQGSCRVISTNGEELLAIARKPVDSE